MPPFPGEARIVSTAVQIGSAVQGILIHEAAVLTYAGGSFSQWRDVVVGP